MDDVAHRFLQTPEETNGGGGFEGLARNLLLLQRLTWTKTQTRMRLNFDP